MPQVAETVDALLYDLPNIPPRFSIGRMAAEALIDALRKAQSLGPTGMADVAGKYLSESPAEALEWGMGGLPMKTPRALLKARKLKPDESTDYISRNLRKWARDSEVVEPDGTPLVLYHGTRDDVREFDLGHRNRKDSGWLGHGVYLSSDAEIASTYSTLKAGSASPNVMPLYARLKNPYMATDQDKERLMLIAHNKGEEAGRRASIDFTDKLKAQGHDGVILRHGGGGSKEYVIFDPKDLKSATGNIGTYSEGGTLINTMVPIGLGAGAITATKEQQ